MTAYLLSDDTIVEADTPEALVRQMHCLSYAPAADDWAWMEEVSLRAYEQTGHPIRYGTAEDFVADMMAVGLIREWHEGVHYL